MRRALRVLGLAGSMVATGGAASAQVPLVVEPAERAGFLTRLDYHLAIETLSGDDPQFQWDADVGGEFDIVGLPRARVTTAFNYEAILGEQRQPFDPTQGNYLIEVLGGWRWGRLEAALVFHHTSRHLSDRAKDFGIAWNLLGGQVTWSGSGPRTTWQVQGSAAAAVMVDFVDYSGEFGANALVRRDLTPLVGVAARASVVSRTIDGDLSPRRAQSGGRVEGALRVRGRAAALEVFVGLERRIEADAFIALPKRWALIGLRITSPD